MKPLEMYWLKCQNFGDQLTPYLVKKITGREVRRVAKEAAGIFGCGSIMNDVPKGFDGALLGTGMMYETERRPDLQSADIRAVRGPLTASRIGIECPYGDLGLLFWFSRKSFDKKYDVGVLPHYADQSMGGLPYHRINIMAGVEKVFIAVAQCERLITSSLHGIILADALGITNMWVPSDRVLGDGFKFRDYAASLGERIKKNEWRLGNQRRIEEIAEDLREIVIKTVEDYGGETQ